jgi:dCMP deaminase
MSQQHIICYIPVIHTGYMELFAAHPGAVIHVLGTSVLTKRFDYLRKDIRALEPSVAAEIVRGTGRAAEVLEEDELADVLKRPGLVMPDDDISHALAEDFDLQDITFEPVFLRWDRRAVDTDQDVAPDRTVKLPADDPTITALYEEAGKSTNWWRNVGAALVDGTRVIALAHNSSVPTEYSSAVDGDPRITASRGVGIDTSIDIHAEARLIAEAAAGGKAVKGASIYVSTFPCPTCAKLIAASGIAACYYVEGYATVDGQSLLKASGVEIVKIESSIPSAFPRQKPRKYPSS